MDSMQEEGIARNEVFPFSTAKEEICRATRVKPRPDESFEVVPIIWGSTDLDLELNPSPCHCILMMSWFWGKSWWLFDLGMFDDIGTVNSQLPIIVRIPGLTPVL